MKATEANRVAAGCGRRGPRRAVGPAYRECRRPPGPKLAELMQDFGSKHLPLFSWKRFPNVVGHSTNRMTRDGVRLPENLSGTR
jgi:hypothetical protein